MSFLWSSKSKEKEPTARVESPKPSHVPWHKKSLSGQLGNLTPTQQEAFQRFKQRLIEEKQYTPATPDAKASHSDITLARFLRARRFDPDKAFKQFSDSEAWRKEKKIEELYSSFPLDEFERASRLYPSWNGRRDKQGLPVFVYRIADLDTEAQKYIASQSTERRYQQLTSILEHSIKCVHNICIAISREAQESGVIPPDIPYLRKPEQISSTANIIDLQNVSLLTLWNLRGHLQQTSTLATANYPETLDRIIVLNSPSFFPTVWGWIEGWFDEGTQNKVHILGNPAKDPAAFQSLSRFIDKSNIPRMYGGDLVWDTSLPPNMDEQTKGWLKETANREDIRGPIAIDPDLRRMGREASLDEGGKSEASGDHMGGASRDDADVGADATVSNDHP